VQDVDPAEALARRRDEPLHVFLLRCIGRERPRVAALGLDQVDCLLRGREDRSATNHVRPFAAQDDGGGAAVTDGLSRGLPAPDHDGELPLYSACSSLVSLQLRWLLQNGRQLAHDLGRAGSTFF